MKDFDWYDNVMSVSRKKESITISKEVYDELCDSVRHVLTRAKNLDRRTNKIYNLHLEYIEELRKERQELVIKVNNLESTLEKLCIKRKAENDKRTCNLNTTRS